MENELSSKIIGAAIEVHKILGPGLLESVYESALCYELNLLKIKVLRQVAVPVMYKNINLSSGLCLDILVENKVIVEVKAVEKDNPIFRAQLLTYLKVTDMKLGLLINFGFERAHEGIYRVVNGM